MTVQLERVTLTNRPATAHLVQRHLANIPDGVVTWCGRYGLPHPVIPSTWRTCRACETAAAAGGEG